MNLISNAIKFTASGTINICSEVVPHDATTAKWRCSISDHGIGISSENQQQLFKLFSQLDDSLQRKYGGTGLGLAISRQLLHLMGGEISVRSAAGQGACFTFEIVLPKTEVLVKEILPNNTKTVYSLATNGRVLVAEDSPVNSLVVIGMLKKLGFSKIDSAENGQEAVTCFNQQRYGLVLMDIEMPDMDGHEATQQIRMIEQQQNHDCHTPIIALTAHAFAEERTRCVQSGMDNLLAKPFSKAQLAKVIYQCQQCGK